MERLKVLTLNIWNRQGPWERRLELIRAGLVELQPDVVGLQEVLRLEATGTDQAQTIADGLDYQVAYASAWHVGGGLHFGNAILSRWPIVEQERWTLPTPERDQTRSLLLARIDAPCGRVPVFVTHLSWKLHEADVRRRQVLAIEELVHTHAPFTEFPPILLGDMNAEPDSDEMRFLRGLTVLDGRAAYLADCWSCAGDAGPGHTYSRDNPYALRSREPSRRIDYVFSRGPDRQLRGEPLVARVVLDQPVDGVFASDHYGVYAEIQAAPRPYDAI